MPKRLLKQNQREKQEREERQARFDAIIARVSADQGPAKIGMLGRAYNWAESDYQECVALNKPYPFADPLRVLEYISDQSTDCDTLIAAALFPKYCPTAEKPFENKELTKTRTSFGPKIYRFLLHAIKLEAFQLLALKPGANQTPSEQLSQFRYAALNIAVDNEVVLIRGAYRFVQLLELHETADMRRLNRQIIDHEIKDIKDVIAPVCYRAGWERLRYDLHDICFKIEDPVRYQRIKAKTIGNVTAEDLFEAYEILVDTFKLMVADKFELFEWEAKKLFVLKVVPKSVFSTEQKAGSKRIPVEHVNDRHRFRVIFEENIGMDPEFDYRSLDVKRRREHLAYLAKCVMDLYTSFSVVHGRLSEDPQIQEQFLALAALNPHPTIPNMDNEADFYLVTPKPVSMAGGELGEFNFGFSAVNDSFFLRLRSGKLIKLEGQFLDRLRDENNSKHKEISHISYKTKMSLEEVEGVFIYDERNQLLKLPPGSSDLDYARVHFKDKATLYASSNLQVMIDNDDPTSRRTGRPSRPGTQLITGDRVRFIVE